MTKIVVFCLKFRLSPVCEYLNYYYNITNNYWVIPEKTQTREFEDIAFWKNFLKFLGFFILHMAILEKTVLYLCRFHKIVLHLTPLGNSKAKNVEIQYDIFSISLKIICPIYIYIYTFLYMYIYIHFNLQ